MSQITSHVLDTALGRPASGLTVRLDVLDDHDVWCRLSERTTDRAGRVSDLLGGARLESRSYRLTFETGGYFERNAQPVFYPRIEVMFCIAAPAEHYHLPILLSPFGYSTYRGS
jgi:5-hydroxyisourate hydrolase